MGNSCCTGEDRNDKGDPNMRENKHSRKTDPDIKNKKYLEKRRTE